MNYFIGVDLGTTAVKVVLFDCFGKEISEASRELELIHPIPEWTEQSCKSWYEIPCELIKEVCDGIDGSLVSGISVSSQGITIIPTDSNFRPLCNGISWLDSRATEEMKYACSVIGEEKFFEITGKHPNPLYSLPKLIWLNRNKPEIIEKSNWLLMPMDYFTARMCGNPVTDATMAGGTMLFDISGMDWSDNLCHTFGIEKSKLPFVRPTACFAGFLNEESQKLTGLSENVKIAVGAQDQKIAAYGAGIRQGTATMSLGTAGAIEILCNSTSDSLPTFGFCVGNETSCVLEACINTYGAAMKWARDNAFVGLSYREMDKLAENATPGCNGLRFYPHLSGPSTPHFDRYPRSGWTEITLSTTRGELIRAIYEGLACEIRMNIEAARKSGAVIDSLRLFGGGSKSNILCRIIADVTEVEIQAMNFTEIASFGAAKAAAVCCGCDSFGGNEKYRVYRAENDYSSVYADYTAKQIY